jgi:hypothetical protein
VKPEKEESKEAFIIDLAKGMVKPKIRSWLENREHNP